MTNIKTATARYLKDQFRIEESITISLFEKGLLSEKACRDELLKNEYIQNARPKERQKLKGRLSEKYCVSVELIEKIIHK